MNYLGHLYFSNDDKNLMLNNLFGDFVKGKNLSFYPEEVQKGIQLHRNIDSFMDYHPKVLQLKRKLFEDLPKVSSVAVDLFFDHMLAKKWDKFHIIELNTYLRNFYESIKINTSYFTPAFKSMISNLMQKNWISYYSTIDGLGEACKGVSGRISFDNELKNGKNVFLKFKDEIEKVFFQYMNDAKEKFQV